MGNLGPKQKSLFGQFGTQAKVPFRQFGTQAKVPDHGKGDSGPKLKSLVE